MAKISIPNEKLVEFFFKGFGNLETNRVAGWDFDLSTARWVGSFTGSTFFLGENAKSGDFHGFAFCDGIRNNFENGIDDGFCVSLCDLALNGNCFN